MSSELFTIPLHDFHIAQSAKLAAFAGYMMPMSYAQGSTHEHLHTRISASLFDVSHMGQLLIEGENTIVFLEQLLPINVSSMPLASSKYTVMLNERGGIIDDVILTRKEEHRFHLVINAACREKDITHIKQIAQENPCRIEWEDKCLLALQGPKSEEVMYDIAKDISQLNFMQGRSFNYEGAELWINRSGYTGEDGFELSIVSTHAVSLATKLCNNTLVQCAGLGARDSLRLEAGLPLYGNDMNEDINPIEAKLMFTMAKKRREEGGFIGHSALMPFFANNTSNSLGESGSTQKIKQVRVGLHITERVPIRTGSKLFVSEDSKDTIGWVSSGAITPNVDSPICFAYLPLKYSEIQTTVWTQRRDKRYKATVTSLPFVAHKYKR